MKILLVDDEPVFLRLMQRQLETIGYRNVVTSSSAAEALKLLQSGNDIGLILSDLRMPETDGIEFLRHLGNVHYSGGLVLVSGEDKAVLRAAESVARGHQLHVLGALAKPFETEQLRAVLQRRFVAAPHGADEKRRDYSTDELLWGIANGQFINQYSPWVALSDERIVEAEAQLRWIHPEQGVLLPEQFMPVAEEADSIDDLMRISLSQAIQDASHWRSAGLDLGVTLRYSLVAGAADFPDFVARLLRKAADDPPRLNFDVREGDLIGLAAPGLELLARLRLKGVTLSISEFGREAFSLARLRELPVGRVHLAREIVHGAWSDAILHAKLEDAIETARQFGWGIVAGGVDDAQDLKLVRKLNCDFAEGYAVAGAMHSEELMRWASPSNLMPPTTEHYTVEQGTESVWLAQYWEMHR